MSYRRNRDVPTKGRRIHATDEEWSAVKAAAAKAHLSVSAYVVEAAQLGKAAASDHQPGDVIRLLTACHGLLSEIVQRDTFVSDTDAAAVASELACVTALLEALLSTLAYCDGVKQAYPCC